MSGPLRVGIIGCGMAFQAIHLHALNSLATQFRITAMCEVFDDAAQELAARTGARAVANADELIAAPDVDVVLVATPDNLHHEHVIAACKAKKRAVLAEKPLALDTRLAAEMVKASETNGVPVIVAYPHVYDPMVTKALERWGKPDSFKYGEFRCVIGRNEEFLADCVQLIRTSKRVSFVGGMIGIFDLAITTAQREGTDMEVMDIVAGGMMLGLTSHDIPVMRRFLGDPLKILYAGSRIMGILTDPATAETSIGIDVILDYGLGRVNMQIEVQAMKMHDWHFMLRRDDLHLEVIYPSPFGGNTPAQLKVTTEQDGMTVEEIYSNKYESGYRGEWKHVYDVVVNGATPITSIQEAYKDLQLSEDIVHAIITRTRQGGVQ